MAIYQTEIIDFASIDNASGDFWLTISDHLPWDQDEGAHLFLLQAKLDTYLAFIESGEILRKFPQSGGKKIIINLIGKFELNVKARSFINLATEAIERAGFSIQFSLNRPN